MEEHVHIRFPGNAEGVGKLDASRDSKVFAERRPRRAAKRNGADITSNGALREAALQNLPAPDTKRWVMRRKAAVIAAVRSGLLSIDEACLRYKLSMEEFLSWQRLIESHGLPGLRATRIQLYRRAEESH